MAAILTEGPSSWSSYASSDLLRQSISNTHCDQSKLSWTNEAYRVGLPPGAWEDPMQHSEATPRAHWLTDSRHLHQSSTTSPLPVSSLQARNAQSLPSSLWAGIRKRKLFAFVSLIRLHGFLYRLLVCSCNYSYMNLNPFPMFCNRWIEKKHLKGFFFEYDLTYPLTYRKTKARLLSRFVDIWISVFSDVWYLWCSKPIVG